LVVIPPGIWCINTPVSIKDDRGCRTKIDVRADGDVTKLWKNWSGGLHRQTCYGDIKKELEYFADSVI
jgi:hypothetical protein